MAQSQKTDDITFNYYNDNDYNDHNDYNDYNDSNDYNNYSDYNDYNNYNDEKDSKLGLYLDRELFSELVAQLLQLLQRLLWLQCLQWLW